MNIVRLSSILLLGLLVLSSCEKKETPIDLPPEGDAQVAQVDLGSEYRDQIFFNFENNKIVMTSPYISWDIALEASANGYHVFMNGGKEGSVFNTHEKDITKVTTPPKIKTEEWELDAATGVPDSTAIGEWVDGNNISKGEVYILKFNASFVPDTFKKIKLVSVNADGYVMEYGNLRSTEFKQVTIPKNHQFNFAYFSFAEGGHIATPEPPKETWDIVFTRYRHLYHNLDKFPYTVTGILLNAYQTLAYEENDIPFAEIDGEDVKADKFENLRDVIGFDWKTYDIDKGKYTVNPKKSFVIKTAKGHIWKLHFLSYVGPTNLPGAPSFEFKRIH